MSLLRAALSAPERVRCAALLPAVLLLTLLLASAASAVTFRHMRDRAVPVVIDGYTSDYEPDEAIFNNSRIPLEESHTDSRWQDNEIYQIYVTWDADSIYFAADGVINGNNMLILFDTGRSFSGVKDEQGDPFVGLTRMTGLNTWRRNFLFDNGFLPDVFLATWDGNTTPQLVSVQGPNQAAAETPASGTAVGAFRSSASFSGTLSGRAMEAAVPWWKFLGYADSSGLARLPDAAHHDTVTVLPAEVNELRFVAVVTAGGDGTGGPDSAPDNLTGFQLDSGVQEVIDNYAILPLKADGDSGKAAPPAFGANIKSRVAFRVKPPVTPTNFKLSALKMDRPSFAPQAQQLPRRTVDFSFDLTVTPSLTPEEAAARRLTLSADVYNMRGEHVRRLYTGDRRAASAPGVSVDHPASHFDSWDGRDDAGNVVPGGIYLVRLVLEPSQGRVVAPVVVVR